MATGISSGPTERSHCSGIGRVLVVLSVLGSCRWDASRRAPYAPATVAFVTSRATKNQWFPSVPKVNRIPHFYRRKMWPMPVKCPKLQFVDKTWTDQNRYNVNGLLSDNYLPVFCGVIILVYYLLILKIIFGFFYKIFITIQHFFKHEFNII